MTAQNPTHHAYPTQPRPTYVRWVLRIPGVVEFDAPAVRAVLRAVARTLTDAGIRFGSRTHGSARHVLADPADLVGDMTALRGPEKYGERPGPTLDLSHWESRLAFALAVEPASTSDVAERTFELFEALVEGVHRAVPGATLSPGTGVCIEGGRRLRPRPPRERMDVLLGVALRAFDRRDPVVAPHWSALSSPPAPATVKRLDDDIALVRWVHDWNRQVEDRCRDEEFVADVLGLPIQANYCEAGDPMEAVKPKPKGPLLRYRTTGAIGYAEVDADALRGRTGAVGELLEGLERGFLVPVGRLSELVLILATREEALDAGSMLQGVSGVRFAYRVGPRHIAEPLKPLLWEYADDSRGGA